MFLFGVKGGKSCRGGMGTPTMTRRGARKRPGVQTGSGPSARCAAILLQERPLPGLDAPTTARAVGLPPRGGQYFLSKRKKVPKKARGTATTGKRLLLPILPAGLAMSRAMELSSFHILFERARARLFPPSKWAGLFPSAAYRRSAPPRLAWDKLNQCRLGCYIAAWIILQRRKQA